jgi:hypothetical protein
MKMDGQLGRTLKTQVSCRRECFIGMRTPILYANFNLPDTGQYEPSS